MTVRPSAFLLFACLPGALATPARADVLDQSNVIDWSGNSISNYGASASWDTAQTFTVGISGQLTRLDLQLWYYPFAVPTQNLTVDIATTNNGVPYATGTHVLATRSLTPADVPTGNLPPSPPAFQTIDLSSANIYVQAGDKLDFIVHSPDTNGYGIFCSGNLVNTYGGGSAWLHDIVNANPFADYRSDTGFRTYIAPAPAPEPASLALLVPAVLLFGRRKR